MTGQTGLRDGALQLAGMDWRVFPLRPGAKNPALHHVKNCPHTGPCADGHRGWEQRATNQPEPITATWQRAPYNIGIATGVSDLVVVDCDVLKPGDRVPECWQKRGITTGAEVLRHLAREHGEAIAPTYAVRTPTGGWHLYYRHPATGPQLRITAGKLGWKIDTRSHGGYVVGPGSIIGDRAYELVDDRDPVELPVWLHQALADRPPTAKSAPHQTAAVTLTGYVAAAVANEVSAVQRAPQGRRNSILSRSAYALGQLVGAGVLDEHVARAQLIAAWETWGAVSSASKDIGPGGVIDTSLAAGKNNPRRITGRKDAA